MIRIAITGGIACGKSLAGSVLESAGWAVCEADQVAHALYLPGGLAYDAVAKLGGTGVVREDGTIDRKALAHKVFADRALLVALNGILHPLVRQEIGRWFGVCESKGFVGAAAIIPLLYEADMATGWDAIVCIGCSAEIQRQRLGSRGLDAAEIDARIAAQWPVAQKMAAADFAIWNDDGRDALQTALENVVRGISERE